MSMEEWSICAPKVADQLDMKQKGVAPVEVKPITVPQPRWRGQAWSRRGRGKPAGSESSRRDDEATDLVEAPRPPKNSYSTRPATASSLAINVRSR